MGRWHVECRTCGWTTMGAYNAYDLVLESNWRRHVDRHHPETGPVRTSSGTTSSGCVLVLPLAVVMVLPGLWSAHLL